MSSPNLFSQLSTADARAVILETALKLAADVGDAHLHIGVIADEVGCTEEEVQEFFPDEQAILAAFPDFLRMRMAAYLTAPENALASINTARERLIAYAEAYVEYLNKDPELFHYIFEMRSGLEPGQLEKVLEGRQGDNVSLTTLVNTVEDFAHECGNPNPARSTLVHGGLAAWATVHGMAHLSLLGVLRHQHAAVRRYNYRTIIDSFINSLGRKFAEDHRLDSSPLFAELRPVIEAYSATLPRYAGTPVTPQTDESLLRAVAMDTALEIIGSEGVEAATLRRIATTLDLPMDVAYPLLESEFELREQAETQTDIELSQFFTQVFDALDEDASAVDRLRAMAVAYFHYSITSPYRLNAAIAVGSKSVVPNSTLDHAVVMGEAFKALQDLCHETLVEMGQEPTDQQLYIKTLMLWSGANGACHLLSLGDLRDLPLDQKWALMEDIVEYVLYMFKHDLTV